MGQAKNRGTLEDRRKAPLGDAWRTELNAVEVPRQIESAQPNPAPRMSRSVSRQESRMMLALVAGSLGLHRPL